MNAELVRRFKPEIVQCVYSVQVWTSARKPKPGWLYYGQRNTLDEARERREELRERFKRVRVIEHRHSATVIL
jgi:hypothetical protein